MPKDQIELIARGILVRDDKLLVCRNIKHGHAFLPGGHVEYSESARDALAREMLEETGEKIQVGRFIGLFEAAFLQQRGDKPPRHHHEVNLIFEMKAPEGDTIESREAKIAFDWLVLEEAKRGGMIQPAGILDVVFDDVLLASSMSK